MRFYPHITLGFAFCLQMVSSGSHAEPVWPTGLYEYVVVDEDLRTVLQDFGINNGLRISLSDKVQGRIHGPIPGAVPRDYLKYLADKFGIDWTYDGWTIWISAASETQTEMLPLQGVSFGDLQRNLSDMGVLDARFQFRPSADGDVAVVSGPPHYVTTVRQALSALAARKAPPPQEIERKSVVLMRGASSNTVEFP